MSVVAHFFMSVGGSEIHERLAHFFIDFYKKVLEVFNDYLNKDSVLEVVNTKRGYTVMIWDEKDEQWFGVEHCKAPELLRDALLDGYRDFLEQQLTHNRRSLTETEILDIQNRCEQLYDLCGE